MTNTNAQYFQENPKHLFWYFEWSDKKPTFDPWINIPCIFCWKPLAENKKTISLMKMWDDRSYFYRCCKECYESRTEEEINLYESSLIDNI